MSDNIECHHWLGFGLADILRSGSEVRRVPVNEQWQPGNFQPSRQFQLPTYQTESDFGVPR